MKSALAAAALLAGLLLSACDWSSVGFNAKCKEYCATVDVTENESQAEIESAMKQKCDGIARPQAAALPAGVGTMRPSSPLA